MYRLLVGIVGVAVTVGGLALVPLPGPGWLIVFVGLAILASEFVWAQRLLDFSRDQLRAWTRWLMRQPIWVRLLVSLLAAGFVAGVGCLLVLWQGVPHWILEVLPIGIPIRSR